MPVDLNKVRLLLAGTDIDVVAIEMHSKASENYVEVIFYDEGTSFRWKGLVPYYYRRTGLFIETEEELSEYLKKIRPYFFEDTILKWIEAEKTIWEIEHSGKSVTKQFFQELAKLEWTSAFPSNNNPQRRIQDIKELGYTLATRIVGRGKTERLLLPIPRAENMGYEILSTDLRKRIIKVLDSVNAYELSSANKAGLLPDHKFPEIRWDKNTKTDNPDDMSDTEIKGKFQLLDNQRNQQKREVCRHCFQLGERGILFGIKFFYEGGEIWDNRIPKIGKDAEQGCIGCGWYDIQQWREELNKIVKQ